MYRFLLLEPSFPTLAKISLVLEAMRGGQAGLLKSEELWITGGLLRGKT